MTTFQVIIVTITSSIIAAIFSALITFFITTVSQRKVVKETTEDLIASIEKLIDTHIKIYHKKDPEEMVKSALKEHERKCISLKEMGFIKKGLIILLDKLGGNISNLDIEGAK